MKKIVMTLCAVIVVFNTLCAQSGNWTDEGNYDISCYKDSEQSFTLSTPQEVADIAVLAQNRKSLQYKTICLSTDIDLSAHYWVPISFLSGNIEGNNHTISSMYISGEYSTAGFIAVSDSDFIQNLKFNRCQLNIRFNTSGYQFGIGGIIGTHNLTSSNSLLLSNCHFNGEIRIEASKGNLLAGSILGCIYGKSKQPEIKECSNEASLQINYPSDIPSDSYTNNMLSVGGIVGNKSGEEILVVNSENRDEISAISNDGDV